VWAFEHSVETTASPATVWRLYRDVASWPSWNGAVERLELDGEFEAGATGKLTPPGGEPMTFTILSATENAGYVSQTSIAETVGLRATNTITPSHGGGCRITHRAELVGPAAEYFGQSFGPALKAGVPKGAEALAARAAELERVGS
jgi:uncharacterized protein YndB with AHSA1/START domain